MNDTTETHDPNAVLPHDAAVARLAQGMPVTYEVAGYYRAPHPTWIDLDAIVRPETVQLMAAAYGDLAEAMIALRPILEDARKALRQNEDELNEGLRYWAGDLHDSVNLWTGASNLFDLVDGLARWADAVMNGRELPATVVDPDD